MPRPAMPIGAWGAINVAADPTSTKTKPVYVARTRFRDGDGKIRHVERAGQSKSAARTALLEVLAKRAESVTSGIGRDSRVADLAADWQVEFERGPASVNTKRVYASNVKNHIIPRLGHLRLSEATTKRCNDALNAVATEAGPSAAKTARAVLGLIMGSAVRHDAIKVNPVREVKTPTVARKKPRSLTKEQANELGDLLRAHPAAIQADLPDLYDLMLATGARIGEALAIRRQLDAESSAQTLDLAAGTLEINATLIRATGRGLFVQERPKTAAGWRVLALPPYAVDMLRARYAAERLHPAAIDLLDEHDRPWQSDRMRMAFPSPHARSLRDPSNTHNDLRHIVDGLQCDACEHTGYQLMDADEIRKAKLDPNQRHFRANPKNGRPIRCTEGPWAWFTSHILRKSVATWLEESGWTPRQVADQLGHAKPSMTQDVYFGRSVTNAAAAQDLAR